MMGKRLINQILPCLFFGLSEMHTCNHQVDVICCFDIQASKAAWVAKLCSNSWCTSFGIETCVNDHPGRRIQVQTKLMTIWSTLLSVLAARTNCKKKKEVESDHHMCCKRALQVKERKKEIT